MHVSHLKGILKKTFIGFFLFLIFAFPFSFSIQSDNGTLSSSVSTNIALADNATIVETYITGPLGNIVLSTAAMVTWVGGNILEISLEKLVFGMGKMINGSDSNGSTLGATINTIWSVVRDFSNLIFIFGFIYVGITTIIDPESSHPKKFLTQIILGAILINFSLFFSKIIIDLSNLTSVEIYKAMTANTGDIDISSAFAQQLGISTLYNMESATALADITASAGFWFYIMGAIMLVIAGFILAAGGILLIVRFVVLVFLMMFSPLLFAATVFPQTASYSKQLWGYLISYSFFAPVYLFLLFVSIKILGSITETLGIGRDAGLRDGSLATSLSSGRADSFDMILNFIIVIFFLIYSLQISKKLGIAGGEAALSIGDKLRRGTQGYLGRGALRANIKGFGVGAGVDKIAKTTKAWEESNNKWKQRAALGLQATGVYAGAKGIKGAKFGSSRSRDDVKKEDDELEARRARSKQLTEIKDLAKNPNRGIVTGPSGQPVDQNKEFYAKVQGASHEQLTEILKGMKPESAEYKEVVRAMSSSQVEKFMEEKQENFDDAKKNNLSAIRKSHVAEMDSNTSTLSQTDRTTMIAREITNRKPKDVAKLDKTILEDPHTAGLMTPTLFQKLIDEKVDQGVLQNIFTNMQTRITNGQSMQSGMAAYLGSSYIQGRFGTTPAPRSQQPPPPPPPPPTTPPPVLTPGQTLSPGGIILNQPGPTPRSSQTFPNSPIINP